MTSITSFAAERNPDLKWMQHLSRTLALAVDRFDWKFSCQTNGKTFTLDTEELTALDGFLPVLLNHTNDLVEEMFGARAPIAFRLQKNAYCAAVPEMDRPTASISVWASFAIQALENWVQHHPQLLAQNQAVPIEPLIEKWEKAMAARQLLLLRAHGPQAARPTAGV